MKAQTEANAGTATAVAQPTFSVPAGSFSSVVSVAIKTTTTGASIRYTLDGSTPSSTKGTLYSTAFTITSAKNYLFHGKGNGTFASAETYNIGTGTGPGRILLVDVNGDERPDAVITNGSTNQVTVLLNQTP